MEFICGFLLGFVTAIVLLFTAAFAYKNKM